MSGQTETVTINDLANEFNAKPKFLRSVINSLGIERPAGRKQYRLNLYQKELVKEKILCRSDCSPQVKEETKPITSSVLSMAKRSKNPQKQWIINWRSKR